EQGETLRLAARTELGQRLVERLDAEHRRLALVEDAEARVEARGKRVLAEQPRAEAVDRRDPGAVELAHELRAAELGEALADPAAELGRGALGVGDAEDRA